MANATIHDYELDSDVHNVYDVTLPTGATVSTVITTSAALIDAWIADTCRSREPLVVGLDVEWRPNFNANQENPVATLQLCVAERCLIVQLIHAENPLPSSLFAFLDDPSHSFVGVGIVSDAEKILCDYGLRVSNAVDLGPVAARVYGDRSLQSKGLKDLALRVVGLSVAKPRRVTMGRWDYRWLNSEQVKYACVDAYASYLIGKSLLHGQERNMYIPYIPEAPHSLKPFVNDTYNDVIMTMSPELLKRHVNASDRYEISKTLFQCRMSEGASVGNHMLKMIEHVESLDRMGFPMGQELASDLVLQSLPPSYDQFVLNYIADEIVKPLPELLGVLIKVEADLKKTQPETGPIVRTSNRKLVAKAIKPKGGVPKKGKVVAQMVKKPKGEPKEGKCFHCMETGHWKRNCTFYLEELRKKQAEALTSGE